MGPDRVPIMLGLAGERPGTIDGRKLRPLRAHGPVAMSIGLRIVLSKALLPAANRTPTLHSG